MTVTVFDIVHSYRFHVLDTGLPWVSSGEEKSVVQRSSSHEEAAWVSLETK